MGETWCGPFGSSALAVSARGGELRVEAAGSPVSLGEVYRFLGLDAPLAAIYRGIETDAHVAGAVEALRGMRILRQDTWECLATYICSQWNNIPKIEASTERIARLWGPLHRLEVEGQPVEVASFPGPETLARLHPDELRQCALGYRCGYLVDTARRVAGGEIDLLSLRSAGYETALSALLALPGIGRKVADCILLFSLDQWEAFPVDVWVRRIMHELYGGPLRCTLPDAASRRAKGLSDLEYRALVRFAWNRWGALAGWAQEYLFYARRLGLLAVTEAQRHRAAGQRKQ